MTDQVLRTALEEHRVITIIYQKDREITERNIKVLEVEGDSVKAFCYLRKKPRVFARSNILAAALQAENACKI